MDYGQILSWIVSVVGFTGFIFAGKKKWWSWYINLACQILWGAYALVTGQLAFLVFAAAYFVIFARNAYLWTKDELASKKLRNGVMQLQVGGTIEHNGVKITRNADLDEESNLVKHARSELAHIGEEPEVIEWYVRVIKEYASFGHSGGSHMAVMPCLTRLLNFQPLTALTSDPNEWVHHSSEVYGTPNGIWQNQRDSRAFSEDGGETFSYVDDPNKSIHKTECNICWSNRDRNDDFTCPGCGATSGNYTYVGE